MNNLDMVLVVTGKERKVDKKSMKSYYEYKVTLKNSHSITNFKGSITLDSDKWKLGNTIELEGIVNNKKTFKTLDDHMNNVESDEDILDGVFPQDGDGIDDGFEKSPP